MTGAKQSLPVSAFADWNFDQVIVMWRRRDNCARALQRCTTATSADQCCHGQVPVIACTGESPGSFQLIYTHCFILGPAQDFESANLEEMNICAMARPLLA